MGTKKQSTEEQANIIKTRIIKLNFQQQHKVIEETEASVSFSYGAKYSELKENNIQLAFGLRIKITQEDKSKKEVEIVNFEIILGGIFPYENKLDKKVINNSVLALHSYAIPIIIQTFALANFPPLNIPILDVTKIKAEKEIEK